MVRSIAVGVLGILLLLAGLVFALQGADVIGGSSFMNGSSTWIYVGALIAVIGVLVAVMGFAPRQVSPMSPQAGKGS